MPLFLISTFVVSVACGAYISYSTLNDVYRMILFGYNNPKATVVILMSLIIGIHMFLFALKPIAHAIVNLAFRRTYTDKLMTPEETIYQEQSKRRVKSSVDIWVTIISSFTAIITCLTTVVAAAKEFYSKKDIIDINKNIIIEKIYSIDDKKKWFDNLYEQTTSMQQFSKDGWNKIRDSLPWESINTPAALKAKLSEDISNYIKQMVKTDISNSVTEALTKPEIVQTSYKPIIIAFIAVIVTIACITGVYYYHTQKIDELTNFTQSINEDVLANTENINILTNITIVAADNSKNAVFAIDSTLERMEKIESILEMNRTSHEIIQEQIIQHTEIVESLSQKLVCSVNNASTSMHQNLDPIIEAITQLENKTNMQQHTINTLNETVNSLCETTALLKTKIIDVMARADKYNEALQTYAMSNEESMNALKEIINSLQ